MDLVSCLAHLVTNRAQGVLALGEVRMTPVVLAQGVLVSLFYLLRVYLFAQGVLVCLFYRPSLMHDTHIQVV